jgi:hypothetical protein
MRFAAMAANVAQATMRSEISQPPPQGEASRVGGLSGLLGQA